MKIESTITIRGKQEVIIESDIDIFGFFNMGNYTRYKKPIAVR